MLEHDQGKITSLNIIGLDPDKKTSSTLKQNLRKGDIPFQCPFIPYAE
jgi:hypothetical protein